MGAGTWSRDRTNDCCGGAFVLDIRFEGTLSFDEVSGSAILRWRYLGLREGLICRCEGARP